MAVIAEGRRKKEEGSSATDSLSADVTDVTDVTDVRRKKEEARKSIVSAINNVLTVLAVAITLNSQQSTVNS